MRFTQLVAVATSLLTFASAAPSTNSLAKRSVSSAPVIPHNFPDPSLIQVNNMWYSFATRTINSTVHIQAASSPDFKTWTIKMISGTFGAAGSKQFDALPNLPSWAVQSVQGSNVWAPDIIELDDGSFVMYYSASAASQSQTHCVGAARSNTIFGPYTADSKPLFCNLAAGGAIDASGYSERVISGYTTSPSGAKVAQYKTLRYVVYKQDGGSVGLTSTPLILHQVSATDGTTLVGNQTTLLNNRGAADDNVTEAPDIVKGPDGTYVLFFSSGDFTTRRYTVSYATSPKSIYGPYTRQPALLASGDHGLSGPGGASVWRFDDTHMVFHANRNYNYAANNRLMYTALITIGNKGVVSV